SIDRSGFAVPLDRFDCAIESDPGHDLRMCEMSAWSADFPDPFIRFTPRLLEMSEESLLQRPRVGIVLEAGATREMQGVHHLAVDIELKLRACGVSETHGLRTFVTWQPRQLQLGEPPL